MKNRKNHEKKEAKEWLKRLRSNSNAGLGDYFLKNLREEVQKGGFTLEDIGASEKKLEKLLIKSYKISAKEWLIDLRSDIEGYHLPLKNLREKVQKGGFTLEDIGTNEKELEELRVKSYKTSAEEYLEYIRSNTNQYYLTIQYLREEVQKGGFTLEDIGTNEKELEELRCDSCNL